MEPCSTKSPALEARADAPRPRFGRVRAPAPSRVLVIGYGNDLRADDGLGPRIAAAIDEARFPGVQVFTVHQLTPELAEPISRAAAVVFIDASTSAGSGIQVQRLCPRLAGRIRAHHAHPSALLALALRVYGKAPRSWWLTAQAKDLGYRLGLSSEAEALIAPAVKQFAELRRQLTAARRRHRRSEMNAAPGKRPSSPAAR